MEKFYKSACLYEVYKEILFLTSNYQDEYMSDKAISKLDNSDLDNFKKSKTLHKYGNTLKNMNNELDFDEKFINILIDKDYDIENVKYMIKYLDSYKDSFLDGYKRLVDRIAYIMDIKMKENGLIGEFPLYMKLSSDECLLSRAFVSFNTGSILNNETKKLMFKISYMEYQVPLDEYKYNGTNLKGLSKEEIIKIMDSSVKVNLNNAKYFYAPSKEVSFGDELILPSDGELSLLLDKKMYESDNIKDALKQALKSSLKTVGLIIILTIVFFLFKYLGGK